MRGNYYKFMRIKGIIFSIFTIVFFIFTVIYLSNNSKNLGIKIPSIKITPVKLISKPISENKLHKVIRVVDGDTIEIETGEIVRYIGMNTPETVDPRKTVECFGKEASNKNKDLVEGKEVRLVKDVSDKDKYGRLLRYVYVGDIFINLELVKQGYAQVSTFPPDVKYKDEFLKAQREAREKNLGLWNKCK